MGEPGYDIKKKPSIDTNPQKSGGVGPLPKAQPGMMNKWEPPASMSASASKGEGSDGPVKDSQEGSGKSISPDYASHRSADAEAHDKLHTSNEIKFEFGGHGALTGAFVLTIEAGHPGVPLGVGELQAWKNTVGLRLNDVSTHLEKAALNDEWSGDVIDGLAVSVEASLLRARR